MAPVEKLGFIGLGVMGGRMCRNLMEKAGKPVVAFDVDPAKAEALTQHGVTAASSVADVVAQADIIFMCVPGEPQVRDVVFGAGALLGNVRAGQTLVDMTTATVEVNREVAAALAEKNVAFADAPVARGVPAAENGTLAITVGASDDVFEAILPYLKCMGGDISHCGGIGNGQVLKLMNNMLIFQNVAALAEAMAIATRAGVERSKVFDILSKGSADSYAMRKHGAHMVTGDYPDDQFPVTYSLKDIGYALDLAEKCGVDAQSAKHAEGRLKLAAEKGYGNYYSPVIYRLFEE
ncbi:MAG: NAD(P)-dependent oxidoreductase [Rhizobiales bacterium]|nr:NAD(P)-dependent oxidoreductase [Hyphomicrobiales bacterium]